jgi:hypothetical protein
MLVLPQRRRERERGRRAGGEERGADRRTPRAREREAGRGLRKARGGAGLRELGRREGKKRSRPAWAAWAVFLFPGFSNPFLFLFLVFNFKPIWIQIKFEFNSYALNEIKLMHQHECTNMSNLK